MKQGQDHAPTQPDPLWLQEQKRRLSEELRPWRLLICTTDRTYGLLMAAHTLDTPAGQPSQQLLGLCQRAADVPALLPEIATNVLVLSQEFLQDGPALPVLGQLLQRSSPPTVLLSLANPHRVVIRAALAAGVQGLISQENVGRGVVLQAVTSLGKGQAFLDARCQAVLAETGPASLELTAREVEQPRPEPHRLRHRRRRPGQPGRQPTAGRCPEAAAAEPSRPGDLVHPAGATPGPHRRRPGGGAPGRRRG